VALRERGRSLCVRFLSWTRLRSARFSRTAVTSVDAQELLNSLSTLGLPADHHGGPGCDVVAVEGLLVRLRAMVETDPEIAELDLIPVICGSDGAPIVERTGTCRAGPRRPRQCRLVSTRQGFGWWTEHGCGGRFGW